MTITLQLKVTPNGSKNEFLGWEGETLRVRIKGIPEKGRVNEELIAFLSQTFRIAKSQIEIKTGHTSRLKRVKLEGVTQEQINAIVASK